MTREEHLAWCKHRAIEYVDRGELHQGISSMFSDLLKHPETADLVWLHTGQWIDLLELDHLDAGSTRKFINGFECPGHD